LFLLCRNIILLVTPPARDDKKGEEKFRFHEKFMLNFISPLDSIHTHKQPNGKVFFPPLAFSSKLNENTFYGRHKNIFYASLLLSLGRRRPLLQMQEEE
jgi:hypothetical protein